MFSFVLRFISVSISSGTLSCCVIVLHAYIFKRDLMLFIHLQALCHAVLLVSPGICLHVAWSPGACHAVLLYYMLISSSMLSCCSHIFRHCVMLCYLYLHAYVFMLHDLKALWHAVLQVSACIASWCVTLTSRHCIMLCFMHLLEFVLMCHRYLLALCQLSCSVARISRHCHAVSHTSSDIILLCYMYLQALCHVSCVLSILSCRMYF